MHQTKLKPTLTQRKTCNQHISPTNIQQNFCRMKVSPKALNTRCEKLVKKKREHSTSGIRNQGKQGIAPCLQPVAEPRKSGRGPRRP